jgi:hypothetical protein
LTVNNVLVLLLDYKLWSKSQKIGLSFHVTSFPIRKLRPAKFVHSKDLHKLSL